MTSEPTKDQATEGRILYRNEGHGNFVLMALRDIILIHRGYALPPDSQVISRD